MFSANVFEMAPFSKEKGAISKTFAAKMHALIAHF